MNRKFYIILFCISLWLGNNTIFGQELPPIQRFTPMDYDGENQNWKISQAPDKFIYVANNEGLLEYNGAKWTMYPSPNNTIIRAVKAVNNKIYTGCYMEFGYWERNEFGKLLYQSLVSKFNEAMVEDEHIWNIATYDEWILFQSFDRIYFYNPISGDQLIVKPKNPVSKVFNVNSVIYYHVNNEGIYKIEAGESKLFISNSIVKNDKVINVYSIPEGLLIHTKVHGFYKLINDKFIKWKIPAEEMLQDMNIFSSIQLKDKSFVIGTIKNGVIILSKNGRLEYQIDRSCGLGNNTVLCLYEDVDNNLWAGLDNGINCINLKSPIRVFNDDEGKIGTVYASIVYNDFLYLGTNQGLFYKRVSHNEELTFMDGTAGQVWTLFKYNNELFCGHHAGTYLINTDNKAILVSSTPGTWLFKSLLGKENMLLEGNYNGLNVLHKENGNWKLRNKIQGFNNSARYFELVKNNEVWVSHAYKGVFRLTINEDFTEVKEVMLDSIAPIDKNSSLAKFKNRIIYASKDGVLAYDTTKNSFKKDTVLSPLVTQSEYVSGKLVVDETQKLWAFSDDNISYVDVNDLTNQLLTHRIALPYQLRKGQVGYENIAPIKQSNYLIGITDGYLTIDISRTNNNSNEPIVLNAIELSLVGESNKLVDIENPGNFKYANNSIRFRFSVPNYDKYSVVQFQYKLDGRYNQWSEWDDKSELTFDNLPFGDYSLNIRAKVGNRLSSNTINYNFIINKPLLLSNTAIMLYLAVLFFLLTLMHRAYKKHYKKQSERKQLESEQLIVNLKNEKLSQDIESKNKQLAISTMSIIKKNEVLNSIKKELKKTNHRDNKSTLKLIDSNLNDDDDWSFFEQAFNNANQDFLNKMKLAHPDLNSNDLRFCAYMRLNLSSKEMAPLLNISVKSVETKRYRLRKKLDLQHDMGLIDYILSF
ncbi:Y_Y_Y domain-containing protein [Saccharicrinis carchari]|uniref:Y_Y_Y domain-containing protein n=1 Tax=Saccharicrinis carchari TaxID=1168039 RepID=A0A521B0Q7_SACCC|nr:triple tyrosine motif-containing protein [Saccharicrinis carchari]SMO40666.1 Y_Y_Y domain-containing protein [Saccharicrinis carchari]